MFSRHRIAVALVTAAAALASVQCGDDITTGRRRVSFDLFARGVHLDGTTSMGWNVRIETAAAALGPVGWFEGEALFGQRRGSWGFGVAAAHPGHYVPGGALADVTRRVAVDLATPSATFVARADGVSGEVRSAHLELRSPDDDLGPARALLHGGTLYVRGVATRGATTLRFEASANLDVNVEGIPARATLDGAVGHWMLSVDVLRWIDRVDFSEVPAGASPTAVVTLPASGQGANALYRGASSGAAYRFEFVLGPADAGR